MNDKPKIYSTCKAGCQWETIHRSEFETIAPLARQYPSSTEDGTTYDIKIGKEYKAIDEQPNSSFSAKLIARCVTTAGTFNYVIFDEPQNPDKFSNTFIFKVLGLDEFSIVYEFCGIRYSFPLTNVVNILELRLYWGGELYIHNSDATIRAEDGKSAYEIVVEKGEYEGTEEEWAKSLNPEYIASLVLAQMPKAEDLTYGE